MIKPLSFLELSNWFSWFNDLDSSDFLKSQKVRAVRPEPDHMALAIDGFYSNWTVQSSFKSLICNCISSTEEIYSFKLYKKGNTINQLTQISDIRIFLETGSSTATQSKNKLIYFLNLIQLGQQKLTYIFILKI